MPTLKSNLEDRLGVSVEVIPVDFSTQQKAATNDERATHLQMMKHGLVPSRLDPTEITMRFEGTKVGPTPQWRPAQWVNCQYTDLAHQQTQAQSIEERREMVNEAHSIFSENFIAAPLVENTVFGAARKDMVTVDAAGKSGVYYQNPWVYVYSTPKDSDQIVSSMYPVFFDSLNFLSIGSITIAMWNHLTHSSLLEYDENYELRNGLAESYDIENDGKRVVVTLKDDAVFHNGDPVTAEDVKFTFEQLVRDPAAVPQAIVPPYDSIKVVDEKTTAFNLTQPYLPLISMVWPKWGILHKESWVEAGAKENPLEFELDTLIGSGPFEVSNFQKGSHLTLTPFEGDHPNHNPEHQLTFRSFEGEEAERIALEEGEIQMTDQISPGTANSLSQSMGDQVEVTSASGYMPHQIYIRCNFGPSQFTEFRAAVSAVPDRKKINQLGFYGESAPMLKCCMMPESHPWRPPEDMLEWMTESETGSEEEARAILEEAGWGWDDQGRLRYPSDADTSPLWPKGERPDADQFPCMDSDGNWVPPEER
jgi:peptide/nickel transport system substrate-binding protein